MFSVVDKVLVRPLPIDQPDRVVVIWSRERLTSGSIGELYEVQPGDPLTLTSMAVLLLVVSTAAILIPVWRATRVDPVCALRE